MKVKVKKLSPLAKMPYKKYDSDFCFDVYATSCEEVAPNVYKYGLGFAMQIERGDEEVMILGNERFKNRVSIDTSQMPLKFDIDLRPRSSVWKTGMVLSNSVGHSGRELHRRSFSGILPCHAEHAEVRNWG
jgi:hypothetical protein